VAGHFGSPRVYFAARRFQHRPEGAVRRDEEDAVSKLIRHTRSREAARWLRDEVAAQKRRYRAILAEQDALAPRRDKWIDEFLQRIQTRGYHVHFDQLRKIPADEIPTRPKRKFKVVF
jgi:hypothetical protein